MLYNGEDKCPDHAVLTLSSMFKDLEDSSFANLELKVDVYNINKGRNKEFAKRSKSLEGYEYFISLIKENLEAGINRGEAIRQSVLECIRVGVLKEFLTEHGSEVCNMLLTLTLDDAKKIGWEEGREDGIAIGEARGVEKGVTIGREEGVAIGEAKVLDLLAKGYSLEQIKEALKK